MAPVATETTTPAAAPAGKAAGNATTSSFPRPLQLTGVLDNYPFEENTPVIGRTYPTIQIKDLLQAPNSDELLRELAIVISRRGVVFLKNQDLSPQEQQQFTSKLSKLTGNSGGLHIHPILNSERESEHKPIDDKGTINTDDTISVISSKFRQATYYESLKTGADEWHSDITFEKIPADYTTLKVFEGPETGGDTLFSSAYEVYDLLSPQLKKLADSLTGNFAQPAFNEAARKGGYRVHPGPRGAPENSGEELAAKHPFVRTNPVTGWKSILGLGSHFANLDGLPRRESELIKNYILELATTSHFAQVRFKWGKNDLAVFDNRAVYHAATPDYFGLGPRAAVRVISVGEKPYFDPESISRREELGNSKLI